MRSYFILRWQHYHLKGVVGWVKKITYHFSFGLPTTTPCGAWLEGQTTINILIIDTLMCHSRTFTSDVTFVHLCHFKFNFDFILDLCVYFACSLGVGLQSIHLYNLWFVLKRMTDKLPSTRSGPRLKLWTSDLIDASNAGFRLKPSSSVMLKILPQRFGWLDGELEEWTLRLDRFPLDCRFCLVSVRIRFQFGSGVLRSVRFSSVHLVGHVPSEPWWWGGLKKGEDIQ